MLGTFIVLIALMMSGIGATMDNIRLMDKPIFKLPNGIPIYLERRGAYRLASGEKIRTWYKTDIYGNSVTVYLNSRGIMLYDPDIDNLKRELAQDAEELRKAKERGMKVYMKFYVEYHKRLPTEISTGLTCGSYMLSKSKYHLSKDYCYKYYFKDGNINHSYGKTEITREEYRKYIPTGAVG